MHGAQTSWWTFFAPGDGFNFDYAAIAPTPVPPTLLLFATGLGALGVLGLAQEAEAICAMRDEKSSTLPKRRAATKLVLPEQTKPRR